MLDTDEDSCVSARAKCPVVLPSFFAIGVANHKLVCRFTPKRTIMDRLRRVCHTEDRKVLVSIDRLDLCKVLSLIHI